MKELLKELGFETLPMLSEFVKVASKKDDGYYTMDGFLVLKYTNFITQPLTKGMFIPCDDDGKPLPFTIGKNGTKIYSVGSVHIVKAKERVLFNCEITILGDLGTFRVEVNNIMIYYFNGNDKTEVWKNNCITIEQAINAGVKLELR